MHVCESLYHAPDLFVAVCPHPPFFCQLLLEAAQFWLRLPSTSLMAPAISSSIWTPALPTEICASHSEFPVAFRTIQTPRMFSVPPLLPHPPLLLLLPLGSELLLSPHPIWSIHLPCICPCSAAVMPLPTGPFAAPAGYLVASASRGPPYPSALRPVNHTPSQCFEG